LSQLRRRLVVGQPQISAEEHRNILGLGAWSTSRSRRRRRWTRWCWCGSCRRALISRLSS